MTKEQFIEMNTIDLNEFLKERDGQLYVSWADTWAQVKKLHPDATFRVWHDPETHKPYIEDSKLGYMCFTEVTIAGLTHEMWLPVMDSKNKAMKSEPYEYEVFSYKNGKKIWDEEKQTYKTYTKIVEPATMFDINKTIMRCLVKNLALFGLGLYVYRGEDVPDASDSEDNISAIIEKVKACKTEEELKKIWNAKENRELQKNCNEFIVAVTQQTRILRAGVSCDSDKPKKEVSENNKNNNNDKKEEK